MPDKRQTATQPILEVDNLSIAYETRNGDVDAVRNISFSVNQGETFGLVGESGCGKSTVAFSILGFLGQNGKITSGKIRFEGNDLSGRSGKELRGLRGNKISVVYQDPMQALNPSLRLGEQLTEVLTCHQPIDIRAARLQAIDMLHRVHMPDAETVMDRYPHQISGGQQQRVVIAMAMLNKPYLLIMDEPTTALDVTVEAAVLDLVEEIKTEFQTAIIFITHSLGVIARVSDRIGVMYAGELVEEGTKQAIFKHAAHPYTLGLLSCVPKLGESKTDAVLTPIPGHVPPIKERKIPGCVFQPRCFWAKEKCENNRPGLLDVAPFHKARCFCAPEVLKNPGAFKKKGIAEPLPEQGKVSAASGEHLLQLEKIKIYYHEKTSAIKKLLGLGERKSVQAVENVGFSLSKGQTIGIVGESGCGKSTLAKGIIGLEPVLSGQMEFLKMDITRPLAHRNISLIKEIQMVFQNPDSTLNPSYTVGAQIARPIKRFHTVPKNQVKSEVERILRAVRLDVSYFDRYSRQLSGGEKQRVGIARALASQPDLVICDEPVSALDVSVQASVVNLLLEIIETRNTALVFIAHDLSVVRYLSDQVAVMYLGQIMEMGPVEAIYAPPFHPYTEALLSAVPVPDPDIRQNKIRLAGTIPSALSPPKGCRFHTRCHRKNSLPKNGAMCETVAPPWKVQDGHGIRCHVPLKMLRGMQTQ